jgi:hypothetical protein
LLLYLLCTSYEVQIHVPSMFQLIGTVHIISKSFVLLCSLLRVSSSFSLCQNLNLHHFLVNECDKSGVFCFTYQTQIAWFAPEQQIVETATYALDFMVAKQAFEQIMTFYFLPFICWEFQLMVPPGLTFGDNASIIS